MMTKPTNQWKVGDECFRIDHPRIKKGRITKQCLNAQLGGSERLFTYFKESGNHEEIACNEEGLFHTKEEAKQYLINYINSL